MTRIIATSILIGLLALPSAGQIPTRRGAPDKAVPQTSVSPASHQENVIRETVAFTYPPDQKVLVKFRGTTRLPGADGKATVEHKRSMTAIKMETNDMKPASLFGGDFNTYVLWVVSPEGQIQNVGELLLDGDHSKSEASTNLGTFAMFVTAEPHYLVTKPSRFVVLETSGTDPDLKNHAQLATIQYRGFEGAYNYERETLDKTKGAKGPVQSEVKQAYTAIQLAERAGADEFAKAELDKARQGLEATLALSQQRKDDKALNARAREVVRLAASAQKTAEERTVQAALQSERQAREAQLSDLEKRIREATTDAERARLEAERREIQLQAEARARDEAARRADEAAQHAADANRRASEATERAAEAQQLRTQAEARATQAEKTADEARKQQQEAFSQMRDALSRVVEIRETARGLILNIPDVLFDFDKATLRNEGRERLSKIAGIILAAPGTWELSVEGHTDSIGTEEYNQQLSEKRADTVKNYLIAQGVSRDAVTAKGFGKSQPIASNDSESGRQRNRRVEIIIEDNSLTRTTQ
jgi:outer membrane protein OmpA-like peptidoglycan-associated protein